ncbi:hypothetical protein [Cyanobacterium sp. Dongsha4]|uniref:hypothetical protein n=1 Tax=Cyanobacterium sp. DS4 TaxID=2878255 RepID=UPI002E7FEBFA|nr:hypothetical protein [Cyanobacterium sp. Dongsha4]WVL00415.1 hypothetical protein Dongsha4_17485 [Cyanobacterium sp. Dongsha4]
MKKHIPSITTYLQGSKLYLDDLAEIINFLKENQICCKIFIDEYELELDEINDILSITEKEKFNRLEIKPEKLFQDKSLNLTIDKYGISIFHEDDPLLTGIIEKIKKITEKRVTFMEKYNQYNLFFSIIILFIYFLLFYFLPDTQYLLLIFFIISMVINLSYLYSLYIFFNKQKVVFIAKKYNEVDNYFKRHIDQIRTGLITSIIGVTIGSLITSFIRIKFGFL